jgi:hypothetical protein
MTTGRINQVAFLFDADTRMSRLERAPYRDPDQSVKTCATVVRVKGRCAWLEAQTSRPRISFRIREHGHRLRGPLRPSVKAQGTRGTRSLPRVHPTPRRARGGRGNQIRRIPFRGQATQDTERTLEQRHCLGKNEADDALTVRCTSTEPANPRRPITTHTPYRSLGYGLAQRTATPEGKLPSRLLKRTPRPSRHRWTRRQRTTSESPVKKPRPKAKAAPRSAARQYQRIRARKVAEKATRWGRILPGRDRRRGGRPGTAAYRGGLARGKAEGAPNAPDKAHRCGQTGEKATRATESVGERSP